MSALHDSGLSFQLSRGTLWRWGAAAAVVVTVHAAGLWYAQQWHVPVTPPASPPSMVMIDLAPMVVAPEAVPTDQADVIESKPSETVEETIEPIEEEQPVEKLAEVEEVKPLEEVVEPEIEEVIPDIQEAPKPEVVIQTPVEKPKVEKPRPVKKKPAEKAKPIEKKVVEKPKPEKKPARKSASAPSARKGAEEGEKAAAPIFSRSAGKEMTVAQWKAKVSARIGSRAGRAKVRGSGSINIRFSVNSSGVITSASVTRSSGKPELDAAALRIVQSASPVLAPPGGARPVDIPITFQR